MRINNLGLLIALLSSYISFGMGPKAPLPDLPTAQKVDLNRYLGKWYEIARIEQFFEVGCVSSKAEYSLRPDGKINVKNSCNKDSCGGRISEAIGIAKVIDRENNSKLKVSFFWPFKGDYWILEVDPEYTYAVVGAPDRKSFWILSRLPTLDQTLIQNILEKFKPLGFDLDHLVFNQVCE